jgi:uncharacterized protein
MKLVRLFALTTLCIAAQAQAQNSPPAAAAAPAPLSAAKRELVNKLMQLQQNEVEGTARKLAQEPAGALLQQASRVIQNQVPAEKRESVAKSIDAMAKKYVDETVPLVTERAVKLAPSTIGASIGEQMTEDELKSLVATLDSPAYKKYQAAMPEIFRNFVQKLVADARPAVEPKVKALDENVRTALTTATAGGAGAESTPAKAPAKGRAK